MIAEWISLAEFAFFATVLLASFRYLGAAGLFVFTALGVVIGNLQVLLETQYAFQSESVALGTVIFAMTFMATDMLTEHYGRRVAQINVAVSFLTQLFVVITMVLTLAYQPLNSESHNAMQVLFSPTPRILLASLSAYGFSQCMDITIFSYFRRRTSSIKWLWFRSNISTIISAFFDNCIFSSLAWYFLAPEPCSLSHLFFTYILGTFWLRVLASFWATPIIYLSYRFKGNFSVDKIAAPLKTAAFQSSFFKAS